MTRVKFGAALGVAAVLFGAASAQASTFVASTSSSPTALTALVAGTTYHVTATGTSNLLNGGELDFDANGLPTHVIDNAYSSLYPNGGYADPTSGNLGVGGLNGKLGSLLGTFTSTPSSAADFFELGADYTFTAGASGELYALINDVSGVYTDNQSGTGFTVSIGAKAPDGASGAPEPAAWTLMIMGFGLAGAALRRRSTNLAVA